MKPPFPSFFRSKYQFIKTLYVKKWTFKCHMLLYNFRKQINTNRFTETLQKKGPQKLKRESVRDTGITLYETLADEDWESRRVEYLWKEKGWVDRGSGWRSDGLKMRGDTGNRHQTKSKGFVGLVLVRNGVGYLIETTRNITENKWTHEYPWFDPFFYFLTRGYDRSHTTRGSSTKWLNTHRQ